MLSNEYIKGFRAAVSSYAMNTPRGAYDARPSFTPRKRASDQTLNAEELTNKADHNRPLPDELMDLLRVQLTPDTYQMLCDALNGGANHQDPDEEDKPATGMSPDLIEKIIELVAPHLDDDDNEEFKQLASRARSSSKSPAEDARHILSLTPGQLAYDNGTPFTGERNGYRYYQGVRLNNRPRKVSSSSMKDYASRFPGAARIKVL